MPEVRSIAFTHTLRRQWADYWAMRPNDDEPGLLFYEWWHAAGAVAFNQWLQDNPE